MSNRTTRLTQQDLQIYPSQRLTDTPDGGGQMSGTPLTGADNELFPPVSDVDRTMGSFDARLVYGAVLRNDSEPLYGGHFVISEPPKAKNVSFLAFKAQNYGEERQNIMPRVEAYSVPTIESAMTLLGIQLSGSRLVQAYQREEEDLPIVGQRYCLKDDAHMQYIRISDVKSVVRTFTDEYGNEFKRRVLTLTITDGLVYDFEGAEYPNKRKANTKAKLLETQVADTARYYGVRPLAKAISKDDTEIAIDSIYEKLVPTSTVETALADQYPAGGTAWIETAPRQRVAYIAGTHSGNIYLQSSVLPGSVELVGYEDNGQGQLVHSNGNILSVDYQEGLIKNSSSIAVGEVFAVPASLVNTTTYSYAIDINDTNQGTEWAPLLTPKPANGSLVVSFMSGGAWYELKDYGDYILRDSSAKERGRITRAGSCIISLPALPDVNSKIVLSWAPLSAFETVGGGEVGTAVSLPPKAAQAVLNHADLSNLKPGTLSLSWNNGGAKNAQDSNGTLTGDISGSVDYASGQITLSNAPMAEFTVNAEVYTGLRNSARVSITTANDLITGTIGACVAGSVHISLDISLFDGVFAKYLWDNSAAKTALSYDIYDDGNGGLYYLGQTLVGATIAYDTGKFSIKTASLVRNGRDLAFDDADVLSGHTPLSYIRVGRSGTPRRQLKADVGSAAVVSFIAGGAKTKQVSVKVNSGNYALNVLENVAWPRRCVSNSWILEVNGTKLIERNGVFYKNIDPKTGNGEAVGSLDMTTGKILFTETALNSGQASILAGVIFHNDLRMKRFCGRTLAAPIKPQSFTVYAQGNTAKNATAGADEQLTGSFTGSVDTETGFFDIRTDGDELPESLRFNVVTQSYIPLDSSIIGIDAVRLPPDGRVPIFRKGDMIVIGNRAKQDLGSSFTARQVVELERKNGDRVCLLDANGVHVKAEKYSVNLEAGQITFAEPLDLGEYAMPLSAVVAWEEENRVIDVDISGRLKLQFGISRAYPQENTYVSSALIGGDLLVRATEPFSQQAWDKVWSDSLRGDEILAKLDVKNYPIALTSNGAITERWLILFTSDSQFELYGENLGLVAKGDTLTDLAPVNPATGKPYFTLPRLAFGGGWAARNCVRFNTYGTPMPVWILRAVQPSANRQSERDGFLACLRGNTVVE